MSVGGTPALEQDSIHSLFAKLPLMVLVLIITTTILMFLAFGSLVLPIKAALMSALTLGSTMGILTWMFVDGHGSGLMNYTPQPLMAPMIGLIIAVIWGLSTDYEVFLVSRMVEARERGMSTAEAIRIGTATTGRLITGAALVLAVVAGAFVFSDLVMMKYLAFGLLIALLLDATVVRMFLVPAVMKLLGDDCWWAPQWMKRMQERLGLGETELPDERKRPAVRERGGRAGRRRRTAAASFAGRCHRTTRPIPPSRARRGRAPRRRVSRPRRPARTARRSPAPPACRPRAPTRPANRPPPAADGQHQEAAQRDQRVDDADPSARSGRRRHRYGRTAKSSRGWANCAATAPPPPPPAPRPRRAAGRRADHRDPDADPRGGRPIKDAEPTTAIPAQRPQDPEATEKLTAQRRRRRRPGAAAASAPRTCCAGKAAGASSVAVVREFDVVGLGLDDLALFGLLSLCSSASGSLASSTRTALFRKATVGTASSAPTMPASTPPAAMASTTASGWIDTARPITSGCSTWPSSCCTAMMSAEGDQRVDEALGEQRDDDGEEPGDDRTDQRDERAEKHQRGQRQRQRHAHDRQPGADPDGVDQRDEKRRANIADQRLEPGPARVANPVLDVFGEDLGDELPDVAPAVQEEDQGEQHKQCARDDFGHGGRRRQRTAGQLGLVVAQRFDGRVARVGDLVLAQVRGTLDQPRACASRWIG